MTAFRKSMHPHAHVYVDRGSVTVNDMTVMQIKEVKSKDDSEPTTVVETKVVNAIDYAKTAALPKDEDYQLRDMLKAGQIPQEVPVHGMLDSNDPTDLSNQGVGDAILDQLSSQVKSVEPAVEPAPSVEPSNAE